MEIEGNDRQSIYTLKLKEGLIVSQKTIYPYRDSGLTNENERSKSGVKNLYVRILERSASVCKDTIFQFVIGCNLSRSHTTRKTVGEVTTVK